MDSVVITKKQVRSNHATTVLKEIKQQLEKQGYEVAEQVGQSKFKCSLALKINAEDQEYTLGIFIDDDKHYDKNNLLEQYYQRPAILKSFGWRSIHVFAKDWLHQPEKVMEQIIKKGEGRTHYTH